MPDLAQALRILSAPENRSLLTRIRRGVEKESLRVSGDGRLAQTDHPASLGSALTHPAITTDYSEALLEMITAPYQSVAEVLQTLDDIHRYIYHNIGTEMLWVNSMPCSFSNDSEVPVARYGTSNVGRMKTVYRLGLGHRYGRIMQTIAGIHYNWSIPDEALSLLQTGAGNCVSFQDYKTQRYFDLIRNFRRRTWLLLYLFGAAPAVCRSYVKNKPHNLVPVGDDDHSLHTPYATSLRMGDLGYQSSAQESLTVCYNSLDNYIDTLRGALTQPYPAYDAIGIKDAQGHYQQLSTHLLQIENEFYGTIRPKRTTRSGETPIKALHERGVEYIEVRCLDLNPFTPLGIDEEQILFLDIFLMHCLLDNSPATDETEYRSILANQKTTVYRGREPGLQLMDRSKPRTLIEWGKSLFEQMLPIAKLLDEGYGSDQYQATLRSLARRLDQPELTPSARQLRLMQEPKTTYFQLALAQARQNRDHFLAQPPSPAVTHHYQQLAAKSLVDQHDLEAADSISFEEYLARYYHQYQQ